MSRGVGAAAIRVWSAVGSCPVSAQRLCGALGLNPVRCVEVVALVEDVEGEIGEDRARPFGHLTVVVRVAPAA
jgi:hypothetical protein